MGQITSEQGIATATPTDELLGSEATRVLVNAARCHAQVDLTRPSDGASMPGTLDRVTDTTVEILVRDTELLDHAADRDGRFNVTVNLPKEPFWFTSDLVATDRTEGVAKLVLRRAARVSRCQRRRFRRTAVRPSSVVQIRGDGVGPVRRGPMLNISPDGMACRFDRADADALSLEDVLGLRFSLDGDDYVYRLAGVLKSKTPASDADKIILRLQFRTEDMSSAIRERLHRACAGTYPPS